MLTSEYMGSYDGTIIHYMVNRIPKNPTLVFIHGAGSNYTTWRKVLPQFADRSYIAVDMRNHGLSGFGKFSLERVTRDIAETINAEKLKEFIPVGMSLGGPVALELAKRFPTKAKKLILISPSSRSFIRGSGAMITIFKAARGLLSYLPSRKKLRFVAHKTRMPLLLSPFRELLGIHARDFFCAAEKSMDTELDFHNAKQPILLVTGKKDFLMKKKVIAKELIKHPNITHIEVPAYHLILDEQPKSASNIIAAFAGEQ